MNIERLRKIIEYSDLNKEDMNVDDVLILMELFALPYKAVVLRLAESEAITERKAQQLLQKMNYLEKVERSRTKHF